MPFRLPLLLALLAVLAAPLSGCDSDGADEAETFTVQLRPLNDSGVSGTATVRVGDDGAFTVALNATGLDATGHPQHIHGSAMAVSSCPTAAADANGDGFVDVMEGAPSYGGILLPLDDDISNQTPNASGFPQGTSISYSASTTFAQVRQLLERDDPNADDPIMTLGAGASVDLGDYAIVVHGTTRTLPGTVGTIPGLPNTATLPVACGTL